MAAARRRPARGAGVGGVVLQSTDSDLDLIAIKFCFSDEPRSLQPTCVTDPLYCIVLYFAGAIRSE